MPRARRTCNHPGCPNTTNPGQPRCPAHQRQAQRARGSQAKDQPRDYSSRAHRTFRSQVLDRDPLCVLCGAVATVADHWPTSKRDLITSGLNPNDPSRGRGLCKPCHDRETATHQPTDWHPQGGGPSPPAKA